ncbi:DUF3530 family protein [Saccharophagus sp. K07]|uniref:DUF3530 family protein n=1 Tax=Saccharophagus sp. K07 TaxID=2283636 RepID=UPI00351C9904
MVMSRAKHSAPRRQLPLLLGLLLSIMPLTFATIAAQEPDAPLAPQATPEELDISTPSAPANLPVPIRLENTQRQLLTELKGPPSTVWLQVGDKSVPAFWQPDQSGNPRGAVLLLHAQGQHPRWKSTMQRLHQYLPVHGWATLSVELPDLPPPAIPKRPEKPNPPKETTAETASAGATSPEQDVPGDNTASVNDLDVGDSTPDETATNETAAPAQEPPAKPTRKEVMGQIQQRIQAGTDFLHQQGQFNLVLLGEDISTLWALQYLETAVPPTPITSADSKRKAIIERAIRAVVLLNPRLPADTSLPPLTDLLQHPQVPTFDVFSDLSLEARQEAQIRRQKAKQMRYENYVQRRLPPMTGANPDADEILVTKAIRGFLQKHCQGVEFQ